MIKRLLLIFMFPLLVISHSLMAAPGIDEETGLVTGNGFETVRDNCTYCHSAQIITQNRMDREGWLETIRWMQETQGLNEFDPEAEKEILDYLSIHYAPSKTYRRPPLNIQWE